jgi:predicted DsbA family dithiol-disulfide isomerase
VNTVRKLRLQVVADLICPWCYIGKRSLDQALEILAKQGVQVDVDWVPYLLNPALPSEGMDRKAFRTKRFGWDNALAMDARAVEAGRRVGAMFRYELQGRTSNTVAAHALVRLARAEEGAKVQERVVDALFTGYFAEGKDIGDAAVLEGIATAAGLSPGALERSIEGHNEVRALDAGIKAAGVESVPAYLLDGRFFFSGSQDVAAYVERLSSIAQAA